MAGEAEKRPIQYAGCFGTSVGDLISSIAVPIPLNICLTTSRCVLRCASEDDLESVWSATRYPGFNDGMRWNPPKLKSEISAWTDRNLGIWKRGEEYVFTVRKRLDNSFIGRVSIRREKGQGVWSIGFWIHPERWGEGFATEASRAIIDFAFEDLKAEKIIASHALWNIASKRVMEKLGLVYVRENPRSFVKKGEWVAEADYETDRESWRARERPQ